MTKHSTQPASSCAKCGACAPVCPVFQVEGRDSLTARGRMHLLTVKSGQLSALSADLFSRCLLCGACETVCARQLPIRQIITQVRSSFPVLLGPAQIQKAAACAALGRPTLLEGLVRAGISLRRILSLPADSGLRLKLALLEERPVLSSPLLAADTNQSSQADLSYFTGCFARHLQLSVAQATTSLLKDCGLKTSIPSAQCCCGLAAWSSGNLAAARDLARRNIQAFAATAGLIITSCASCSAHLLAYPNLFAEHDPWRARAQAFAARVQEFTDFFNQHLPLPDSSSGLRVFYHDPCHLRFRNNGIKTPRSLLNKMGFTVLEPQDSPRCCGQGGLFHLACPDTSAKIFAESSAQALADAPDCITSTCSGCLMQYQQGLASLNKEIRVAHPAVLLEEMRRGESCA